MNWAITGVKGSREGVIKFVTCFKYKLEDKTEADLPEHWKSFLLGEIAAVPEEFNFFSLDVHYCPHDQHCTPHISLHWKTVL